MRVVYAVRRLEYLRVDSVLSHYALAFFFSRCIIRLQRSEVIQITQVRFTDELCFRQPRTLSILLAICSGLIGMPDAGGRDRRQIQFKTFDCCARRPLQTGPMISPLSSFKLQASSADLGDN
ncbi:hypothetical protein BV22DRAFT_289451 [Leucogyrophana mollusca]|uniref:Uncharacterized protein n=1 Tax=Leucogyrophana mollusca TaxID=85980 RepID=A0ACB8BPB2_9AGAM|nr:hypothetical protein BV22DRAFT_289451 [Leucogyrophana mollusca]